MTLSPIMIPANSALILLHGNLSDTINVCNYISNLSPRIMTIGADGGALYGLKHNLLPDVIIGDLDSLQERISLPQSLISFTKKDYSPGFPESKEISISSKEIPEFQKLDEKTIKIIAYPKQKDFTDAELAVQYGLKSGATNLFIFGLLGDRLDHMMANIFYFAKLYEKGYKIMKKRGDPIGTINIIIIEGNQEITYITKEKEFIGEKGDELSLLPLKADCEGVTSQGLFYNLSDEMLEFGSTRGISNIFTNKTAKVEVKSGVLLAIHRKK